MTQPTSDTHAPLLALLAAATATLVCTSDPKKAREQATAQQKEEAAQIAAAPVVKDPVIAQALGCQRPGEVVFLLKPIPKPTAEPQHYRPQHFRCGPAPQG